MSKILDLEDFRKNKKICLTGERKKCYGEILKTANTDSAPVNGVFLYAFKADENGKYNKYPSKPLFAAFSESATSQSCVAHLKKANKMTNNQNTKTPIQALWDACQALQGCISVDDSFHGSQAYDAYYNIWWEIPNTIACLKSETPEDNKIKLEALKIILSLDGTAGELGESEKTALSIVNQLLAA